MSPPTDFTNGIHANTILVYKANLNREQFEYFRRELLANMTGPANSRRLPIVPLPLTPEGGQAAASDLKAVNLGQPNREMEFTQWINWQLKLLCAAFQMDPVELGFLFGNEGRSHSLQSKGPRERIEYSKEKGLYPLLRTVSRWVSKYWVQRIDEDFEFEVTGLMRLDPDKQVDIDMRAVRGFATINEVRKRHGLPELDEPFGNLILDPTFINFYMQDYEEKKQQEEQPQGGPGAPGGAPAGLLPAGAGEGGGETAGGPPEGAEGAQEEVSWLSKLLGKGASPEALARQRADDAGLQAAFEMAGLDGATRYVAELIKANAHEGRLRGLKTTTGRWVAREDGTGHLVVVEVGE